MMWRGGADGAPPQCAEPIVEEVCRREDRCISVRQPVRERLQTTSRDYT